MREQIEALVREAGETLAHVLVHAGHAMAPEVKARAEKVRVACRDFRLAAIAQGAGEAAVTVDVPVRNAIVGTLRQAARYVEFAVAHAPLAGVDPAPAQTVRDNIAKSIAALTPQRGTGGE